MGTNILRKKVFFLCGNSGVVLAFGLSRRQSTCPVNGRRNGGIRGVRNGRSAGFANLQLDSLEVSRCAQRVRGMSQDSGDRTKNEVERGGRVYRVL
jgi:hypothetical protein